MLDFLMWFPYPVRMVVIFGIMFAVVPLAGICTFGNWEQAKAYTLVWSKTVGGMIAVALVIALLFR